MTPKPLSRQRLYQIRMQEQGKCSRCCTRPLAEDSKIHCAPCRDKNREESFRHARTKAGTPLDAPKSTRGRVSKAQAEAKLRATLENLGDSISDSFARVLIEECLRRGWTPSRLAKESGIGVVSTSNFLTRRHDPSINTIAALLTAVGATLTLELEP